MNAESELVPNPGYKALSQISMFLIFHFKSKVALNALSEKGPGESLARLLPFLQTPAVPRQRGGLQYLSLGRDSRSVGEAPPPTG